MLNQIKQKSVFQFKKEVKQKIREASLQYLLNISKEHSKMNNLKYNKLAMQEYFYSTSFRKNESQLLFKYRTQMTKFAANFPNGLSSLTCPLCKIESTIDSENHAFNCEKMIILIPSIINKKFLNIYSKDIKIMKDSMQVMTEIFDLRKQLLD